MQITNSYDDPSVVPPEVRKKYVWLETGNAAAILQATSPAEYGELIAVLRDFTLQADTWLVAGGNKGDIAEMFDDKFRQLGWKETRIDTEVRGVFLTDFIKKGGDYIPQQRTS
ncbi:MAG TPA: BglII/BstYI family type II restriction endonuclease, partial [Candidatus Limnocylindrales bacterium]|nr:BglII/BstYI family type II restriction endonuclease [Candidatus Limnocylindrales bacterium]